MFCPECHSLQNAARSAQMEIEVLRREGCARTAAGLRVDTCLRWLDEAYERLQGGLYRLSLHQSGPHGFGLVRVRRADFTGCTSLHSSDGN